MTWLNLDERKKFRKSIGQLTEFNGRIETFLRKKQEIPLNIRQSVYQMTNCTDMGEAYDALLDIKESTQAAYLTNILEMAPKSLSAFAEYMNPDEPPAHHHEYLIEHLEAIETGDLQRMILSMPPGHAKPIVRDAPVLMSDGSYKALGDINVGDMVITHEGRPRAVTAVHEQGNLPVWEVTLKSGRVLRCAGDHPWLTARGWIRADKLSKIDSIVCTAPTIEDTSGKTTEDFIFAGYTMFTTQIISDDNEVVRFIGEYLTNEVCDDVITSATNLGFEAKYAFKSRTAQIANRIYYTPKCNKYMEEIGIIQSIQDNKIPDWVFKGSNEQVFAFVKAAWRACFNDRLRSRWTEHSRYKTVFFPTEEQAFQFSKLLWRLGFNCTHSNYSVKFENKNKGFNLYAKKQSKFKAKIALDTFEIGKLLDSFNDVYKEIRTRFARLSEVRDDPVMKVVQLTVTEPMRCLTVDEDHSFTAWGLVTHNSTYASHLFPAWYLGRNPKKRYLQAGHTQKFCEDELGKKVRNNVKSEAYQKIFPDIHIPQDTSAAATWAIAKYGGKYMVRAVGQGIAGLRGHIAGVDDPYPLLEDAESQTYRDKVYNWFMSDFKTRLLPNSPLFCVMTRWHGDDLAGRLEESNNNKSSIPYTVINLPIICAEEGDPLGRKIGDLLWPELFNFQFVADVKSSMIPRVWASLYAGNPIPDNGNMLKPEWIRRYSEENTIFSNKISALGHDKFVTVSVDTANKATERSDYSAITVWYQVNDKHYLIDVVRRRMEYTELVSTIEYQARKHKANVILVEDAGTGTQYHIQATNTNHTPPCPVVAIKPHGSSKEFKFDAVLPLFEGGHVFLPANADWLGTYEKELLEFPSSKNDDQVDSTSQYLLYRRPKAKFGSQKMNSTAAAKTTGNFQPDEAIDLVRTGFVDMSHAQDA